MDLSVGGKAEEKHCDVVELQGPYWVEVVCMDGSAKRQTFLLDGNKQCILPFWRMCCYNLSIPCTPLT